jgi:hypothetical protein
LSLNHEFKKLFLKREFFEKSIFHKKVIFLNISLRILKFSGNGGRLGDWGRLGTGDGTVGGRYGRGTPSLSYETPKFLKIILRDYQEFNDEINRKSS